jgi:glycine/betaine/sarcosine/D-proline reductase family selenoprotein B
MPQLALQMGASRVVAGRKIPHPCGDPMLSPELDLKVREQIVATALHALEENVSEPKIFAPANAL